MSFSFYGGPKGQDFNISRVFNNRSNDLLEDLKMRWYSPVNVGDYVYINYGDVHKKDKIITGKNNEVLKVLSDYNRNLKIDLEACGKSYNCSIWQKIYVDENKSISPDFPNSDENVYIFVNVSDNDEKYSVLNQVDGKAFKFILQSENGEKIYNKQIVTIQIHDTNYGTIQVDTSWFFYEENENINYLSLKSEYHEYFSNNSQFSIYYTSELNKPGFSLKETSQIYSEENYGFGYRLIASLVGQTPNIEFKNVLRNIEDGEPGISIDNSILEKPVITFYQNKAQTINKAKSSTIASVYEPQVYLDTANEGTLTNPVLDFNLPKGVEFFSGMLFGSGDFSISSSSLREDGSLSYILNRNELQEAINIVSVLKNTIDDNLNIQVDALSASLPKYYLKNENLWGKCQSNPDLTSLPVGFYGLDLNTNLETWLTEISNVFIRNDDNEIIFNDNTNLWGSYGLITSEERDNMSTIDLINYKKEYLSGLFTPGSFYFIFNKIKKVLPIAYSQTYYHYLEKLSNTIELKETIKDYKKSYIDKIYDKIVNELLEHYDYLLINAYLGDLYINIPTGKLYKFIHNKKSNSINVIYLGPLAGASPEVTSETKNYFKEIINENNEIELVPSEVEVLTNIQNGIALNADFKEQYTFKFPKQPTFNSETNKLNYNEEPEVEMVLDKEKDGYTLNFKLPRARDIKTIDSLEILESYNVGDYFLYTGPINSKKSVLYELTKDEDTGEKNFVEVANFKGNPGMPKTSGEIEISYDIDSTDIQLQIDNNNVLKIIFPRNNVNNYYDTSVKNLLNSAIIKDNNIFKEWIEQFLIQEYDSLFVINVFKDDSSLESYWGIYSYEYGGSIPKIISGSLSEDYLQFSIKTQVAMKHLPVFDDEENAMVINLLYSPISSIDIVCKNSNGVIISNNNYTVDINNKKIKFNYEASEIITVYYSIYKVINEPAEENIFYYDENSKKYYVYDNINKKFNLREIHDWPIATNNYFWILTKIQASTINVIENVDDMIEDDINSIYSVTSINNLLRNSSKLSWESIDGNTLSNWI